MHGHQNQSMEAFPTTFLMRTLLLHIIQPDTDVVAGAVDGTGFFVDDR